MSKRKKSSKQIYQLVALLLVVLGIAAMAMMFLNAITLDAENGNYISGKTLAFGGEALDLIVFKGTFKFNFLVVLAYFLPLVAAILVVVKFVIKNKLFYAIAALLFLVAAILVFIMPNYTNYYTTTILSKSEGVHSLADYSLAIGTILSGVFSAIGAVLSAGLFVVEK